MRYLVAMAGAIVVAGLVTVFLSQRLAGLVVSRMTFDNPDSVSDIHGLVYMAANVAGLILGWAIGWWLGGRWVKPQR